MIGFFIKNNKCNVIPEMSLHDKKYDLYELLNNLPYYQQHCTFCLNDFLNKDSKMSIYSINTEGLNMDWFKSRILVLDCNHIFHLCCFTKYIKYHYNDYMFSKVNINDNSESETSISSSSKSLTKSSSKSLTKSLTKFSSNNNINSDIIDQNIRTDLTLLFDVNDNNILYTSNENDILKNKDQEVLSSLKNYNNYLNKIRQEQLETISQIEKEDEQSDCLSEIDEIIKVDEIISENNKSYYESENNTNNSKYNSFKIECPLCKKKMNCFSTSSILEKYKLLLELYS